MDGDGGTVDQTPGYPMQIMLGLYDFEPGGAYPKRLTIERFQGYRPA